MWQISGALRSGHMTRPLCPVLGLLLAFVSLHNHHRPRSESWSPPYHLLLHHHPRQRESPEFGTPTHCDNGVFFSAAVLVWHYQRAAARRTASRPCLTRTGMSGFLNFFILSDGPRRWSTVSEKGRARRTNIPVLKLTVLQVIHHFFF